MVSCLYTVSTYWLCLAALVLGALGTRLDPCPRHRGLPDGLTKAENKIKDRALYRLDLRNAIRGYTPNDIYRLRVHTTSRKHKYNDAVLLIDALDAECGPGRLIVDTDELYSPKDCPDVVTTQQKTPMGRSHFKWQAPTCGCVHIRVRVHSNSSYYLEDENTHNGPLARTVCLKDGLGRTPSPSPPPPPERETTDSTHHMSREQRLKQLCTESRPHTAEDVLKNKHFASKRDVTLATEFDKERLSIAIEQRRANIIQCCSKGDEMLECFGDVRRRRIDTFCGMGEPDIPFSKKRVDWIKQKKTECCLQIGEDRYTCFNYTLYQETMLNDGRMDETEINSIDLDDFDPVNDIDDYKFASETEEDTRDGNTHPAKKTHNDAVRHSKLTDTTTEPPKRVNRIEKIDTTEGGKDESDRKLDDEDDNDDDDDDIDRDGEQKDEIEHVTRDRVLSVEECCYNGITEGTKVAGEGFEGCFKSADRISTIFTTWTRICDRNFVICCMRVVDGINKHKRQHR